MHEPQQDGPPLSVAAPGLPHVLHELEGVKSKFDGRGFFGWADQGPVSRLALGPPHSHNSAAPAHRSQPPGVGAARRDFFLRRLGRRRTSGSWPRRVIHSRYHDRLCPSGPTSLAKASTSCRLSRKTSFSVCSAINWPHLLASRCSQSKSTTLAASLQVPGEFLAGG